MIYYRGLCSFGLVCVFFVGYGIMGKSLFGLFSEGLLFPVIIGPLVSLIVAYVLDRKYESYNSSDKKLGPTKAIMWSPIIFMSGVLVGSLVNLFINGRPFSGGFGFYHEFFDWFIKPTYWLSLVGIPCSFGVGAISYLCYRLNSRSH